MKKLFFAVVAFAAISFATVSCDKKTEPAQPVEDTTAVAEEGDTRVEIINADSLPSLFQSSPAKIDMILKSLSYRLRSITYDYFKACKEIYDFNND